jgi:two-component system response regulator (stage 0 sporulation protein A)
MDDLISILIVDDNVLFCNVLNDYLSKCEGIIVAGIAKDGIEAIEMIKEFEPEIVTLDLIMPKLDGIGVLERVSMMDLKQKPIFIVLSAVEKDLFIQKAIGLGAEYYILKPFDVAMLVSRIRQLYSEKVASQMKNAVMPVYGTADILQMERSSTEQFITGLIISMGIHPNTAGYRYLREAVIISMENIPSHNLLTKHIYASIAANHNTTAKNVNRAIRGAIDRACKKVWNSEGHNKKTVIDFNCKTKPTNAQVITLLADKAKHKGDNFMK